MPSLQCHILNWILWLTAKKICQSAENLQKAIKDQRRNGDPTPPKKLYKKFDIQETDEHGYRVYTVSPKTGASVDATILYIHGGGFIFDMTPTHWGLIAALTKRLGATIIIPLYPLGPETQLLGIYEALQPLYNKLAAAATLEKPFWCLGDSAGGTMAISFTQMALESSLSTASRLVLITPCTDVSLANPEMHVAVKSDPWLDIPGFLEAARLVYPDMDTKDPRLSPIYGKLKGMPPMLIFAAGKDCLTPDTKEFVALAREDGAEVDFVFKKGLMHIWPAMAWLPEATEAIDKIGQWLLEATR